jgi:hypothetical protein
VVDASQALEWPTHVDYVGESPPQQGTGRCRDLLAYIEWWRLDARGMFRFSGRPDMFGG